jgi:hypothetical protein
MARDHAAASIVLSDTAMIQHVFNFLPPGNWLFLGAVCREWQAVYADEPSDQIFSLSNYLDPKPITCCSKSTLYSAVVASPAMVRRAHTCGLAIVRTISSKQLLAGMLT